MVSPARLFHAQHVLFANVWKRQNRDLTERGNMMENLPTRWRFFLKTRCGEWYRCQWPGLIQMGVICVDEGLTLQTAASLSFHGRNLTLTNLFDTKFSCFIYPPTRLHSSSFLFFLRFAKLMQMYKGLLLQRHIFIYLSHQKFPSFCPTKNAITSFHLRSKAA